MGEGSKEWRGGGGGRRCGWLAEKSKAGKERCKKEKEDKKTKLLMLGYAQKQEEQAFC